jgi:hypothetical protein
MLSKRTRRRHAHLSQFDPNLTSKPVILPASGVLIVPRLPQPLKNGLICKKVIVTCNRFMVLASGKSVRTYRSRMPSEDHPVSVKRFRPPSAYKHGGFSKTVLFPWEDADEFDALHRSLQDTRPLQIEAPRKQRWQKSQK